MLHKEPTFIEKGGEILPNYQGDINGPRNQFGTPLSEAESFAYADDEDLYEGEVLTPEQLRALEMADRVRGEAALEAAFGSLDPVSQDDVESDEQQTAQPMSDEEYQRILDEPEDPYEALGGGIRQVNSGDLTLSDFPGRRQSPQKINPRTGRPTVASQNAAEAAHRRQAERYRRGK